MIKTLFLLIIIIIIIIILSYIKIAQNPKIQKIYDLAKIYQNGKHLILFQNNAELRPTGGFLGSFAVIETKNFFIKKIYFDTNIYKRDNAFVYYNNIVPKDEILKKFVPDYKLQMRDSNWSVDFSQAAPEIAWFYEHEGGTTVDTVTGINTEFMKKILAIIGPIKMVKYDLTISKDNFNKVLQDEIEANYHTSKANQAVDEPKSILSEMYPYLLARLKQIKYFIPIVSQINHSLESKDIIIYSFVPKHQSKIVNYNWGDTITDSIGDYLNINLANLGADKSSIFIKENIDYKIYYSQVNRPVAELIITRDFPLPDYPSANESFARILTPLGSELIEAHKNDELYTPNISQETYKNKNIFRTWVTVGTGEKNIYKFIYYLPSNIDLYNYSLLIQKQPGTVNQHVNVYLLDKLIYAGTLNQDIYLTD